MLQKQTVTTIALPISCRSCGGADSQLDGASIRTWSAAHPPCADVLNCSTLIESTMRCMSSYSRPSSSDRAFRYGSHAWLKSTGAIQESPRNTPLRAEGWGRIRLWYICLASGGKEN